MSLRDVFADTSFWVGLIVRNDAQHDRSQRWALKVTGRIVTTTAVLLETANTLSRPAWRSHVTALLDHLQGRDDVDVLPVDPDLWDEAIELFRERPDKDWSLTDCISFHVMQELKLHDALTADAHYRQAGFRPLLLEEP